MERQLQRGQEVTVNAYCGKQPIVTVVEDRGAVVLVCKPEEYAAAIAANREPISVGFHRADVLDLAISGKKKGASSEAPDERRTSLAGD